MRHFAHSIVLRVPDSCVLLLRGLVVFLILMTEYHTPGKKYSKSTRNGLKIVIQIIDFALKWDFFKLWSGRKVSVLVKAEKGTHSSFKTLSTFVPTYEVCYFKGPFPAQLNKFSHCNKIATQ